LNHTPSLAQHAFLASIDRETKLAVARAYRAHGSRRSVPIGASWRFG
jgi:hypothetical protein